MLIYAFATIGTVLGMTLYGGSASEGWAGVGKGAVGGLILGAAFGVFAVIRGG